MIIRHDAEELAVTAQKIGAKVIRGPVHYPGRGGGLDVGGMDIEQPLYKLKDQEVLVIVAPLPPAQEVSTICVVCGTPCQGGECATCRAEREERLLFDGQFSGLLSES